MRNFATFAAGIALSLSLGAAAFAQDAATAPAPAPDAAPAAAPAAEPAAAPEAPAAEAPAVETPAADAPATASEKGRIIFFRPGRLAGAVYTYHVVETGEDGTSTKESERLGGLPNGGAFVLEAEPGVHNYNIRGPMADNRAEDRLRMDVEPGETYYVEMTFRMGVITSGFALVPSNEAGFTKSKAKFAKAK